MPIYEFAPERIHPLKKTTFGEMQLHERRDLQRLLRENIAVIAPGTLVIAEEYGECWVMLCRLLYSLTSTA